MFGSFPVLSKIITIVQRANAINTRNSLYNCMCDLCADTDFLSQLLHVIYYFWTFTRSPKYILLFQSFELFRIFMFYFIFLFFILVFFPYKINTLTNHNFMALFFFALEWNETYIIIFLIIVSGYCTIVCS